MQSTTIKVNTVIDTSTLTFVMPEKIREYLQGLLSMEGTEGDYKCQILLPEPIENGAYLSFVIFKPIEINVWRVRRIDIYEVINQGQSTKLAGRIDGEHACYSELEGELSLGELVDKWQSSMLDDITNNRISDVRFFSKNHLRLLQSTEHEIIVRYVDQLPEVGCEI